MQKTLQKTNAENNPKKQFKKWVQKTSAENKLLTIKINEYGIPKSKKQF